MAAATVGATSVSLHTAAAAVATAATVATAGALHHMACAVFPCSTAGLTDLPLKCVGRRACQRARNILDPTILGSYSV